MKSISQIKNIVFFLLLVSYSAISQNEESKSSNGGPATANELIGYWKMIPLPNPKMNEINPWPQEYQWFEFTNEGKINSMMSSENKEYSQKELHTFFEVFPKFRVPNYKFEDGFVTIDNPEDENYSEIWGVNIFAKDIEGIAKKGDLIMTLDDGTQTGKVVYYRILRRIE